MQLNMTKFMTKENVLWFCVTALFHQLDSAISLASVHVQDTQFWVTFLHFQLSRCILPKFVCWQIGLQAYPQTAGLTFDPK